MNADRQVCGAPPGRRTSRHGLGRPAGSPRGSTGQHAWVGHQLEADAELDVDPSLSLADAHTVAHGAEHELAYSIPKLGSVIVHPYPAHDAVLSS
jgi:Dimerisation domain of Zinc Transporter